MRRLFRIWQSRLPSPWSARPIMERKMISNRPSRLKERHVGIYATSRNAMRRRQRKFTLLSLVEDPPQGKVYHSDTLFVAHSHTIIWLPPCMCDLNSIALAWRQIKDYVRSHNTTANMSLSTQQELVQKGVKFMTKEDMSGYCTSLTNVEIFVLGKRGNYGRRYR
jgi:hypothetical protein